VLEFLCMKLDISHLIKASFGQKESFNIELHKEQIDEDVLAERTKGELTLTRLDEEILAVFCGSAKVKVLCDRCVCEYYLDLPLNFSQVYVINRAQADTEKIAVEKDSTIDIPEPIRQEILAALPVKKLCKKDCLGICAHCGVDLNEGKCKCKEVVTKKE
jgi:uncharacterized protein